MARYGVKIDTSNSLLIGNEFSFRNLGEADAKAKEIAKNNPHTVVKIIKYPQGRKGFCAAGVTYKKICFGWPDEKGDTMNAKHDIEAWKFLSIAGVTQENCTVYAAAPELLEALKELSYRAVESGANVSSGLFFLNAVTIAQRVIDKAEGRA